MRNSLRHILLVYSDTFPPTEPHKPDAQKKQNRLNVCHISGRGKNHYQHTLSLQASGTLNIFWFLRYDHLHIVYCHCKLYQQFQLDAFLCTTYCYHFIIVICHNSSTMIIRNPLHVLVIFGFVLILIRKISFQLNGNSIAMHCLLSGILFYCRRETFESALILISSIASTTWSIFDE